MKLQLFNLVILSVSLIGLYSPANASVGSDSYFNLETSQILETNRSETNKAFLVYNDNGKDCIISLNEQTEKILNTNHLMKQMENSPMEDTIVFESNEDLKACQPEIAQLVLDSIGKNQVAAIPAMLGIAIGYGLFCGVADVITHKRYEAGINWDRGSRSERLPMEGLTRGTLAVFCLPVYMGTTLIRMGAS